MKHLPTVVSDSISTIVIVNYNGGALLLECVQSIRKYTRNYQLIVVDNASSDRSVDKIGTDERTTVMKSPVNLGFSRASNMAIRIARGKYVALLGSDTQVTQGWLETLISCLNQHTNFGIASPKLLRPNGTVDSAGHSYQFGAGTALDRGQGERDIGQYDAMADMPSCCFAGVVVKKEVFDDIGLFDETLRFYYEDVDFCLRAKIAGWRIIYCPTCIVYHHRGGSTPGPRKKFLADQARPYNLRTILKTYQLHNILRHVFLHNGRRTFNLLLAAGAGMRNRDSTYTKTKLVELAWTFRILLWNILHLPVRERIATQLLRRADDSITFRSRIE